jgi:Cytotoxic translational repressor of toxin-antitoxin stability system
MPRYRVSVHRKADKFLDCLDEKKRRHVLEDILCLETFPEFEKHVDIVKMQGFKNLYRLRTDDLRTIFSVNKERRIIVILKISEREAAYE